MHKLIPPNLDNYSVNTDQDENDDGQPPWDDGPIIVYPRIDPQDVLMVGQDPSPPRIQDVLETMELEPKTDVIHINPSDMDYIRDPDPTEDMARYVPYLPGFRKPSKSISHHQKQTKKDRKRSKIAKQSRKKNR